ncbi:hypothetical protein BZG02_00900 [Labilibaculum filiforme]|uniref:Type IX secretion system membrane protein PorP/SprF n=1 Tax=Labilibaculum filiforme TaxID=1940526 RepID=A0A2N3I5J8_9BACT|nr:type IX secretion system membrane protein PorP/SprF [Labilibaculum filiforme]PKQ65594.1 hypothetical protein BZG02_00900 [Labilibaculum filiforme]
MKYSFLFIFFLFCSVNIQAQEEIRFSNHKYNRLFYNPAYAGNTGFMEAVLAYRNQWVGVDGSPETALVSFQAPINYTNSGVGLVAYQNKFGIQSDIAIFLNYAYQIQISHEGKLSMGLQAGFINKQVNWTELTFYDPNPSSANDALIPDNNISTWVPNFGLGFYYYTPDYYFSLSIPRLLSNDQPSTEGISNNMNFDSKSLFYYLGAGINLPINSEIDFAPSVLFVGSHKTSNLININLDFIHNSGVSVGAGYRSDGTWAGLLGYQLTQKLRFSYSYEKSYGNYPTKGYTNHEIILNYNLSLRKSQITSPRYF